MSRRLAEFVEANKRRLIDAWTERIADLFAIELEQSELRDGLPDFIDDVAKLLRTPADAWGSVESARRHGRSRVELGMDIGALTEEMALLGAQIIELAERDGQPLSSSEMCSLLRVVSRGTADSARAYADARDKELAEETARHFSFIAHEIRTPLNSAQLATQLLAGEGGQRRERHIRRLERSLGSLSDLVDKFLVNAQHVGKPLAVEPQTLSARALAEVARDEVAYQAEQRGLPVVVDLDDFELEADQKLIVSALTNLLNNAVKFTREGGSVTLRARPEGNRAIFEVEDRCGGIPRELLPRLFVPFVESGGKGGFGLGLAIVKQAVEAHGGAVRVENMPGVGCRFALDLPRAGAR